MASLPPRQPRTVKFVALRSMKRFRTASSIAASWSASRVAMRSCTCRRTIATFAKCGARSVVDCCVVRRSRERAAGHFSQHRPPLHGYGVDMVAQEGLAEARVDSVDGGAARSTRSSNACPSRYASIRAGILDHGETPARGLGRVGPQAEKTMRERARRAARCPCLPTSLFAGPNSGVRF